jgi:hypothetical protein
VKRGVHIRNKDKSILQYGKLVAELFQISSCSYTLPELQSTMIFAVRWLIAYMKGAE